MIVETIITIHIVIFALVTRKSKLKPIKAMPRQNRQFSKHDEVLSDVNNLVIDIKLHLLNVKPMSKERIEEIDVVFDNLRKDLESCVDFGLKY